MDEDVKLQCVVCDRVLIEDSDPIFYTTRDTDVVCENCVHTCWQCDDTLSANDSFGQVDGNLWCIYCIQDGAWYCDVCGEYNSDYVISPVDSSNSYCEMCRDDLYWCEGCDEYYVEGCMDCIVDEDGNRVIHDYSYRPDPIFHSTDAGSRLYFGLEVEMEAPRRQPRQEPAEFAQRLERYDLAYLKNDGSLSNGFELVTHPMTHEFLQSEGSELLWATIDGLRNEHKMRSWSTGTCGLHIHISRNGFSGGAHMHRFLNLVYSNREFYTRLAGRESDQWAKFDDVITWKRKDDGSTVVHKTFKQKLTPRLHSDRYSAVNTNNPNTLEMRIFRGTLNTATIKACIDLAHASVEYTRTLSVKDVKDGALERANFVHFIHLNSSKYAQLIAKMDRVFISAESE